ncbi:MAG: alkaline phosphatase [Caulobacter sp.]
MRCIVSLIVAASMIGSGAMAQALPPSQTSDAYFTGSAQRLSTNLAQTPNTGPARNVIIFLGDGMGLSTVAASRIFEGQQRGVDGESNSLVFEAFPFLALSKTYSADVQVTDSAAGITAIMTGLKTRNGVIGLTASAVRENCASAQGAMALNLADIAKAAGRSTGVVTTTRLTHATPAGAYAHTPFRDWEGDADMPPDAKDAGCIDIARQLVEAPLASRMDVAMGGGRSRFLPESADGKRADDRDLTTEWRETGGPGAIYVSNADEMAAVNVTPTTRMLGLFANEHLPFEADRPLTGEGVPTLAAMTLKAIEILRQNPNGYVLLVEGGRIDMASHLGMAGRTVTETVAFAEAVKAALGVVDLDDTLVIVTADHSHGLVLSGYADRNAPILGIAGDEGARVTGLDGKPYTTLMFATGPGGPDGVNEREDPADMDTTSPDYRQAAAVGLRSAAHSGEDVGIYAVGPQAYLFRGVVEETYTFHVARRALGLDGGLPAPASPATAAKPRWKFLGFLGRPAAQ